MNQQNPEQEQPKVIVVERKKKKKYSEGLEDVQRLEKDLTRVSSRIVRAVDKGLAAYREARDESSKDQTDGALIEFGPNMAEGISVTLKELSELPLDLTKNLSRKRAKRIVKGQLRVLAQLGRLTGFR